jgi:hypothetical protein
VAGADQGHVPSRDPGVPDEDTPDDELNAEPVEHWYLTVVERIGDLPDYDN